MHVSIHRHRLQKRLRLELRLSCAPRLIRELVNRRGVLDLRLCGPAARGIHQGQFGGELHPSATAGIEARIGDVGADVVVVGFGECEILVLGAKSRKARAVGGGLGAFHESEHLVELVDGLAVDGAGAGARVGDDRCHCRPPALKCLAQRAIERPGANLEQQVRCFRLPSHLLLLHESAADHLIDGGFGNRGGNRLGVSAAIAIVGNQVAIGFKIVIELIERANELATFGTFRNTVVVLDSLDQCVDTLQALVDVTVPEIPLRAVQEALRVITGIIRICIGNRDTFRHLLQHRKSHGDMEPIDDVLGPRMQSLGPRSHRVAAIGHEGDRLMVHEPLRLQYGANAGTSMAV
jgi:hypothetical protein